MVSSYLLPLRQMMEVYADPDRALQMKNYMQNKFEFYGVMASERKAIFKSFISKAGLPAPENTENVIRELWDQPQREYQLIGCMLMDKLINKVEKGFINQLEFMVIHKSWWDTVDTIASHLIGTHFKRFPEMIDDFTTRWMDSGNMWLQRSALLYQLKYKSDTNEKLLYDLILQLNDSKEFFIRKAIGWVLREYSKTNPESVKQFVDEHTLSGLSQREALKWIKARSN
ncbi:MAG: DNA alkylation repair protein [Bacteroidales bacterium]|nr:DNA alkylation repair protein [Bacteroidales bacterium]